MRKVMISFICLAMFACGGGAGMSGGDDDTSGDDDVPPPQLDPDDCVAFAQAYAQTAPGCGAQLPPNAAQTVEQICRKGVTLASLCQTDTAAGMDCFKSPDQTDFMCVGDGQFFGDAAAYCNNDIEAALGMMCLVRLGDPTCAGIQCEFNQDCPSESTCNDATGRCVSTNGYCPGLPCNFNQDCPSGETCNDAIHSCILQ